MSYIRIDNCHFIFSYFQIGKNFITEEAAEAALELFKNYSELKVETVDLSVSKSGHNSSYYNTIAFKHIPVPAPV